MTAMQIEGSVDFMGTFAHFGSVSSRRIGGEKTGFPLGPGLLQPIFLFGLGGLR